MFLEFRDRRALRVGEVFVAEFALDEAEAEVGVVGKVVGHSVREGLEERYLFRSVDRVQ